MCNSYLSRTSIILLFSFLITACASVDDLRKPAELTDIKQTLDVNKVWDKDTGSGVKDRYAKLYPYFAGDNVYVVDVKGRITALESATGKTLWTRYVGAATTTTANPEANEKPWTSFESDIFAADSASDGANEGSTASTGADISAGVSGNSLLLLLGTEEGNVIAVNRENGVELWRQRLSSEVMAISNVNAETAVVRTNDSQLHGLDVADGRIIWQVKRKSPLLTLRGMSRPLVVSDGVVTGFDDGKLAVYSLRQGKPLWQTTVANPAGRSEIERIVDIDGEMKIGEGVLYASSYRGRLVAVSLADGRLLWSRELSSHNGLDIDVSRVYVTDDEDNVLAFDRNSGAPVWKQDKLKFRKLSAPTSIGNYLVVGDGEGYLHWLSIFDGHFVARSRAGGDAIITPPQVVERRVYVLNAGGKLSVFDTTVSEAAGTATDTHSE